MARTPPRTEVSHSVPGRVRLRVNGRNDGDREAILRSLEGLNATPGVERVRTDRRTGSALLTYDPEVLDPAAAFALINRAHEALGDLAAPVFGEAIDRSVSHAAGAVSHGFSRANQSVLRATKGSIDLRMLTPVTLAGLSIRQLVRTGPGVATIPWYVLAYYSFDTFVKLHGERVRVQTGRPRESGGDPTVDGGSLS